MKKIKSNYIILFVVLFLLTCCFNRKEKIEDEIETGTNIADTGFISKNTLKKSLPDVAYNSVEDNFFAFWAAAPGDDSPSTDSYILGRKISSTGVIESDTVIIRSGPEITIMPHALHNPYTNQYMVIYGVQAGRMNIHGIILNSEGEAVGDSFRVTDVPANQFHYTFAFNTTRRQFFVTYNDSRNGISDVFGVILDETGNIVKEEFVINDSVGHQINPVVAYNSTDDRYLMNWEDLRVHGDITILETLDHLTNIMGALLDGDGNILLNDIEMCVDEATENADQRMNEISYNPNTNEYLASWVYAGGILQNVGIVGRIVDTNGLMPADDFVLVDAPGAQMVGHTHYLAEHDKYYIVFEKDDKDLDIFYFMDLTAELDIGAMWLDGYGQPEGSMIDIFSGIGNQRFNRFAHSPANDTFLILWQDDFDVADDIFGHIMTSGGDIGGTLVTIN